jgi:anti-sigma factor RsiW
MTLRPDWQTLNGYVDGELDARQAAIVAEAAGKDAAVAEEIACLYRLKGSLSEASPAAPADLRTLIPPAKRRSRAPVLAGVAAALCLVAALAVLLLPAGDRPEHLPDGAVATARLLHGEWLVSETADHAEASPSIVLGAISQFDAVPVIPDLSSAKLTIERVSLNERPEGRVLQVGYRGNHGCHLSLFVFPDGGLPPQTAFEQTGRERLYGWQVDKIGYLLMAVGMDPERLDFIARQVETATRSHTPLDARTREALAENKARSAPCVA